MEKPHFFLSLANLIFTIVLMASLSYILFKEEPDLTDALREFLLATTEDMRNA